MSVTSPRGMQPKSYSYGACKNNKVLIHQQKKDEGVSAMPLGEEIIEPEAEVVDSESIRSGNVLVQSTHPGPQPRPQGIST